MSAAALDALLAELGSKVESAEKSELRVTPVLSLGWAELDAALPDGGLPRGVVELSSPHALGGSTSVALAAVRAAQARDARGWCAWLDPEGSLYAPGAAARGIDLERLLVVRPPRAELGRIAVKVCASGAFDVVVIDIDPVPLSAAPSPALARSRRARYEGEVLVRKLALAAERAGSTVLLLTRREAPRAAPWPVALRLELSRPMPHDLAVRVAKDRRGRIGVKKTIPFEGFRADCTEARAPVVLISSTKGRGR